MLQEVQATSDERVAAAAAAATATTTSYRAAAAAATVNRSQTEVGHLCVVVRIEQDVLRLEVSEGEAEAGVRGTGGLRGGTAGEREWHVWMARAVRGAVRARRAV